MYGSSKKFGLTMKRKVLMIMNSLNCGGEENFVMNLYRCLDMDKLQVDFLTSDTNEIQFFENEITEKGGTIYKVPGKNKHPITTLLIIYQIIKREKYNVVHRHSDNSLMALDLCAAAIAGANVRIAHSHTSDISSTKMKILHYLFRPLLNFIATTKYACGVDAGKWLFGNHTFKVIKNGIHVKQFMYDCQMRVKMRERIRVSENTILLGHVGRFEGVKNHMFLVSVLEALSQKYTEDFRLILVGDGQLKERIKQIVYEKKLKDQVYFVDRCNNVNEWLQAIDLFVFPSLYEGLPLSLIEAQASGTRCLVSSSVTSQVKVTPLVEFMSLDEGAERWGERIYEMSLEREKIQDAAKMVIESGYDIRQIATEFETIYGGCDDFCFNADV